MLLKAGVSTNYKAHSTRAAATSFAYEKGVPLKDIIKTAGWSNEKTFAKYYNKPIISSETLLQNVILEWIESMELRMLPAWPRTANICT